MNTRHSIIVNLLRNLGTPREIEQYLSAFTSVDSARFAVVKVGGGVIETQLDELASALAFLHGVGLRPIVAHGAGPQLTAALEAQGEPARWIDGQRVTTPATLAVARRVFQGVATQLADAMDHQGVKARPISSGVFEVTSTSNTALGLVGTVDRVHLDAIRSTITAGYLPIVSPLGETATGQILNLNADVATSELARSLQPRKVVFLTPAGGLLDERGGVIPAINLAEDYDRLGRQPWIAGGMALKLRQIKSLLDTLPDQSSVSITSPDHLAQELFTHRGHGTLIRKGAPIRTITNIDEIHQTRLRDLIERAFGRRLNDRPVLRGEFMRLLIAGDYTAVAVIDDEAPAPYLDKFAVTDQAQGAGIGASLWRRLLDDSPKLFWRTRPDNPINPWYFQRADGMRRSEQWIVFWRGVTDRDTIEQCIAYALNREHSFVCVADTQTESALAC